MAPSTLPRSAVGPLVQAALKMAQFLRYANLGTFEFLVNGPSHEWVFLEINPRLQVEHTITGEVAIVLVIIPYTHPCVLELEEVMHLDLVRVQLLLSQPGASLSTVLPECLPSPPTPHGHAIQLRMVAEDPQKSHTLSTGLLRPTDISWPAGRGVRVDTWLSRGSRIPHDGAGWTIGTDFDSLLAKIIVHARNDREATARASRALWETRIRGSVATNLEVLAGIVAHPDWAAGSVNTRWLEKHMQTVLQLGKQHLYTITPSLLPVMDTTETLYFSAIFPYFSSFSTDSLRYTSRLRHVDGHVTLTRR
ncbi:rudiment single hybrid motif-containing protein [Trametes polyzona]|nr:rudiment single hybrid motif-containing protein [Trametes polyzona]